MAAPTRVLPVREFNPHAPGPELATATERRLFGDATALYRFFDATRQLLYVGVTGQPHERWPKHRRKAQWWFHVAFVAVEHWPSMHTALDAERAAIANERPVFNKRSNGKGARV